MSQYFLSHKTVGTVGATNVLGSNFHTKMTGNYQTAHRSNSKPHDYKPKPGVSRVRLVFMQISKVSGAVEGLVGDKDTGKDKKVPSLPELQGLGACDDSSLTHQMLHGEAVWRKSCKGSLKKCSGPSDGPSKKEGTVTGGPLSHRKQLCSGISCRNGFWDFFFQFLLLTHSISLPIKMKYFFSVSLFRLKKPYTVY